MIFLCVRQVCIFCVFLLDGYLFLFIYGNSNKVCVEFGDFEGFGFLGFDSIGSLYNDGSC